MIQKMRYKIRSPGKVFTWGLHPILITYESVHANKGIAVEHGRNHWITDHYGIALTNAGQLTNKDNERQGTNCTF